jgi:hypothetical protein
MYGNGLKTGTRSLKTPGPGAVAHMSLHQTNNVKEPTDNNNQATIYPDRNQVILPVHVGDHCGVSGETDHTAAVKRALGLPPDSVNTLFVIFASQDYNRLILNNSFRDPGRLEPCEDVEVQVPALPPGPIIGAIGAFPVIPRWGIPGRSPITVVLRCPDVIRGCQARGVCAKASGEARKRCRRFVRHRAI